MLDNAFFDDCKFSDNVITGELSGGVKGVKSEFETVRDRLALTEVLGRLNVVLGVFVALNDEVPLDEEQDEVVEERDKWCWCVLTVGDTNSGYLDDSEYLRVWVWSGFNTGLDEESGCSSLEEFVLFALLLSESFLMPFFKLFNRFNGDVLVADPVAGAELSADKLVEDEAAFNFDDDELRVGNWSMLRLGELSS